MLDLHDDKWATFEGGYRIPYNASVPLLKLEKAADPDTIGSIFDELWNELHHQGDVGLASYMSVPHLIRISADKNLTKYGVFSLIAIIEIQRHKDNPSIPKIYESGYLTAIGTLPELAKTALTEKWDLDIAAGVLSAIAISKGLIPLANAILNLDSEDVINEFLDRY